MMRRSAILCVAVLVALVGVASAATRCDWAAKLLGDLHLGLTPNRMTAMIGWMQGEGSPCRNNPLDTTQDGSGATNCNHVGVKDYATMADGLAATISCMKNGYYGKILAELADNAPATQIAEAIASSKWGTHDAVAATEYCAAHYGTCCNHEVV